MVIKVCNLTRSCCLHLYSRVHPKTTGLYCPKGVAPTTYLLKTIPACISGAGTAAFVFGRSSVGSLQRGLGVRWIWVWKKTPIHGEESLTTSSRRDSSAQEVALLYL